jgi:hypothetical protein
MKVPIRPGFAQSLGLNRLLRLTTDKSLTADSGVPHRMANLLEGAIGRTELVL